MDKQAARLIARFMSAGNPAVDDTFDFDDNNDGMPVRGMVNARGELKSYTSATVHSPSKPAGAQFAQVNGIYHMMLDPQDLRKLRADIQREHGLSPEEYEMNGYVMLNHTVAPPDTNPVKVTGMANLSVQTRQKSLMRDVQVPASGTFKY